MEACRSYEWCVATAARHLWAERRPVAVGVLALSNARLKQVIEQNAIPTNRDASTMQLDLNYRDSSLASDDRNESHQLRAGDRAPDATELKTVEGECRLFDLIRGGRFTLLNFGTMMPDGGVPHDLRKYNIVAETGGPQDIVDSKGHLARAYGAGERSFVLIRPDGYIGLISDEGDTSKKRHILLR